MGTLLVVGPLPCIRTFTDPSQVPVTSVSTSRSLTQSRRAQPALASTSRMIKSHFVHCMSPPPPACSGEVWRGGTAKCLYLSSLFFNAFHAARCVACHGVRSQPVPVAPVAERSIPVV